MGTNFFRYGCTLPDGGAVGADAVKAGFAPLVVLLAGYDVFGGEGEAEFDGAATVGVFDEGEQDFGAVAGEIGVRGDGDEGDPAVGVGGGRQDGLAAAGEAGADFHFDHPVEEVEFADTPGAVEDARELGFGGEVGAFVDDRHGYVIRVA